MSQVGAESVHDAGLIVVVSVEIGGRWEPRTCTKWEFGVGDTGTFNAAIIKHLVALPSVEQLVLLLYSEDLGAGIVRSLGPKSTFVRVDISSPTDIVACAWQLRNMLPRIDVLIFDAATAQQTRQLTADGIEWAFASNILGYFMLLTELVQLLSSSSHARVVHISSPEAGGLDIEDLQFKKRRYDATLAYQQSKQACQMLTWEASRRGFREAGVTIVAAMPAVISAELHRNRDLYFAAQEFGWLVVEAELHASRYNGVYDGYTAHECPWMASQYAPLRAQLWDKCAKLAPSLVGKPLPSWIDFRPLMQAAAAGRYDFFDYNEGALLTRKGNMDIYQDGTMKVQMSSNKVGEREDTADEQFSLQIIDVALDVTTIEFIPKEESDSIVVDGEARSGTLLGVFGTPRKLSVGKWMPCIGIATFVETFEEPDPDDIFNTLGPIPPRYTPSEPDYGTRKLSRVMQVLSKVSRVLLNLSPSD